MELIFHVLLIRKYIWSSIHPEKSHHCGVEYLKIFGDIQCLDQELFLVSAEK
jgi:hypothetical protein